MSAIVFLQLAIILAAGQLLVVVARRVRQPTVVAQLVAGVLVGPSALGALFPDIQHALFPPESLGILRVLGQVGLAVFMFTVGADIDLGGVRRTMRTGVAVSALGTAVPLVAGALLALPISRNPEFFPATTPAPIACLFVAVALAVTAFPVMARILTDLGLMSSPIASLALACGCVSDAIAWSLLAVVLAGISGSTSGALLTLGGTAVLAVVILAGVRPLLARLATSPSRLGEAVRSPAVVLMVLMVVAWASEAIGVHPAFGAFLLGVSMPRVEATEALSRRVTPLASELMLPVFFAYAGLSTSLGLIAEPGAALFMVATVLVACVAKGGSCLLAARQTGLSMRESMAAGVLMNARGLVELVVLTIGLERHVITPTLYAVLVLMTAVTTLLPSPVLAVLYRNQVTFGERRVVASSAPGPVSD